MVELFVVALAMGALAIQVATSSLSDKVRRLFGFRKSLNGLLSISTWKRVMGTAIYPLFPFILVIMVGLGLWKLITEMTECPYCSGFHLGWVSFWLFLDMPLLNAFIYAPLVLVFVTLLDRLMR